MTEKPLAGQVALVTGADRGIGRAIARRLAALGSSLVLCGRARPPLEELAVELAATGEALVAEADVTDVRSLEPVAGLLDRRFGRLDVLVNNAGVGGSSGPLHEMAEAEWERILNTNLRGVYYAIRTFVPLLVRSGGGHIINISSLAGKNPLPNGAAYAASKWGLNGLSYSVAEELRGSGVRVSVICPGSVNTGFSTHGSRDLTKMLLPEDVAHAVAMLVTERSQSFVSEISIRPAQKP